jgi:hypothetical protein
MYFRNHIDNFKIRRSKTLGSNRRWLAITFISRLIDQVAKNISVLLILNIRLLAQQRITEYSIIVSAKHVFFFDFPPAEKIWVVKRKNIEMVGRKKKFGNRSCRFSQFAAVWSGYM